MSTRPAVLLAMVPQFTQDLFTDAHFTRLGTMCEVLDRVPVTNFEEPRAQSFLPRATLLLTSWGCPSVDARVLDRAPQLRAVVHAAGTVKSHVTDACWDRGLTVTSAAAANAVPVAEYTLAAIIFAGKKVLRIQQRYREVRAFRWWPAEFPELGNYGKVVGIVGASYVGRRVIELLRPFNYRVQVYDPFLSNADAAALGVDKSDLDKLFATSHIVSLHAPAVPDTHHLIDRRRLGLLRDGAVLINTARGWLVDGEALEAELKSGRIDAIIDTTEPEVLPTTSPLYTLPNVFLTPHVAGAVSLETQRMADLAIDEIERFTRGEPFRYGIQRADLARIA